MRSLSWTSLRAQHYLKWIQFLAIWELMHRWRKRRYCLRSGTTLPYAAASAKTPSMDVSHDRTVTVQERRYCALSKEKERRALYQPSTLCLWQKGTGNSPGPSLMPQIQQLQTTFLFPGHWGAGHDSQQVTFYPKICFPQVIQNVLLLSSVSNVELKNFFKIKNL